MIDAAQPDAVHHGCSAKVPISGFKTPSKAQWLRCKRLGCLRQAQAPSVSRGARRRPPQNVLLIPPLAGLRFFACPAIGF
jgi:hypothetical protein